MFPRIHLGTAGAVLALAAVPLGALSAQTPSNPPTSGRTPPINPPVIQNPPQPSPNTPTSTSGQNPGGASRAEVAADSLFIRDAVSGNSLEIRLGEIAKDKASTSGVKSFARQMVTDHTKMRDQWRDLAGRNGVNTTLSLDASVEAAANQMATLSPCSRRAKSR